MLKAIRSKLKKPVCSTETKVTELEQRNMQIRIYWVWLFHPIPKKPAVRENKGLKGEGHHFKCKNVSGKWYLMMNSLSHIKDTLLEMNNVWSWVI